MFVSVGRRLALLNAIIVIAVIALVGIGTTLILRAALDREESSLLERRAESAASAWSGQIAVAPLPTPTATSDDDHKDDHKSDDHSNGHEALATGDIVLYGVNTDGEVVINDRGFTFPGLPNAASIAAALQGESNERIVTVNGEQVRIRSVPVYEGTDGKGQVIGAVQAARGQNQIQQQRSAALYATLAGVVIGAIVAPLAGLFLARRAMRPIDAAFATQRAFVADASHELRTPLAVLRANAELIERMPDAPPEEIRAETGQMIAEIDSMTRLVNDLLFLARSDEGVPELIRHEPVALVPILEAETAAHQVRAASAELTLALRIESPAIVSGDADRLRQAVRILLDNALAYTPAGGEVTLTLSTKGNDALIEVRDTGIGIAEEDQERVFDRFYRADRARARRGGGTGLGLSIAKTIVDAHHGALTLTSQPGKGTRVVIRLPAARAES